MVARNLTKESEIEIVYLVITRRTQAHDDQSAETREKMVEKYSLVQYFPELLKVRSVQMPFIPVQTDDVHRPFLHVVVERQICPFQVKRFDWRKETALRSAQRPSILKEDILLTYSHIYTPR